MTATREPVPLHIPDALIDWVPGAEPVVSCLVDWRTSGRGLHEARTLVHHRLREEFLPLDERSAARVSLEADAARIERFLVEEVDTAAAGYAIFACHARNLWLALPLGVPVETFVSTGEYPRLLPLLEATEDAARTLVVLADTNSARLVRLTPGGAEEHAGPARDVQTVQHSTEGGWGALNYQRYIDVEIARFARTVAEAIEREMQGHHLYHLVLSGDTTIVPPLLEALPEALRGRVDSIEHFERWDSLREIVATAWPHVASVVRARREAEVDALVGRAAAGREALGVASEIFLAVAGGRVDTLAVDPDVVDAAASEVLLRHALARRSRVLVARGYAPLAGAGGVVASLR
jgi:hypothetical protein